MTRKLAQDAAIYVAGHRGMVGQAIWRALQRNGYCNLIGRTRDELDLTDQHAVVEFIEQQRPDAVIIAAARVGGIGANVRYPARFFYDNASIALNLIHAAWQVGVERLIFLGSSCIYPRECPQPIKEEYLLSGPLEFTNRPYAVAKIAGIEMCWAYNRQYGTRFVALQPTNLYGPGDRYDLEASHVIPALLLRFDMAKRDNLSAVEVWGSGRPLREFLYVDDLAQACVRVLELDDNELSEIVCSEKMPPLINVGSGEEVSIARLAEMVAATVGYEGEIAFNPVRPDGTPRKLLDSSRMQALGWSAVTSLKDGLVFAYQDMLARRNQ
ncbi:GDP-L-fucose synthase family protein [Tepidimonas sp. HKU79]|uniref:GDP-L-fucose synthase family protein n=1 Tax=Tepidimonas sp. HKU79 TaxID=3414505 RepID=UPI003C7BF4CD